MLNFAGVLCACVALVAGYSDNIQEDSRLDVPDLLKKYGYPFEEYNVTTSDGYILGIHRIPHGRVADNQTDRPMVLLMHGLSGSSADYIYMGPGSSLGYILADAGYDVWLGNARGNIFSRRHLTLNPDAILNTNFWKFSWDEIGNIDVPAIIDFALSVRGKSRLHYVGYSEGTTDFFVMGSLRPEYNDKIISMQALAPVAYLDNTEVILLKVISPFSTNIQMLTSLIGIGELFPNNQILQLAGRTLCLEEAVTRAVCDNIAFLVSGWTAGQINVTMLPVILSSLKSGPSVRQVAHYGQCVSGKHFRRYDHGWLNNKLKYGSYTPPKYPLSNITAPVYLYSSVGDKVAVPEDVERLYQELGKPTDKYELQDESFGHLDFMYSKNVNTLVYDRLISAMGELNES